MSEEVCAAHINLYVNRFSVELGQEGEGAVRLLLERAAREGIVPPPGKPLFVE